jgi:hypothetical protein
MNGGTDFGKPKEYLGGHNNEEVEMVLHEWV